MTGILVQYINYFLVINICMNYVFRVTANIFSYNIDDRKHYLFTFIVFYKYYQILLIAAKVSINNNYSTISKYIDAYFYNLPKSLNIIIPK